MTKRIGFAMWLVRARARTLAARFVIKFPCENGCFKEKYTFDEAQAAKTSHDLLNRLIY